MRHFFLAILLVLFGSGSAVAQSNPDKVQERAEDRSEWETRDALRHLNSFSRCLGERRAASVDAILRLPLHGAEQDDAIRSMLRSLGKRADPYDGCADGMPVDISIDPPGAFLGGMAEARFLALEQSSDGASLAAGAGAFAPRNDWEDFGLCVVSRYPTAALALVKSRPMSNDEETAIRWLTPHFGPCVYADSKLAMDSFALRTYIAVALYHSVDRVGQSE